MDRNFDNNNGVNDDAFDEYRRKMHPGEFEDDREDHAPGHVMRTIFGIFMIVIYVGVGVLVLVNFFNWNFAPEWDWIRYMIGIVLIIYGVWRGYRQYAGIDYYTK